MAPIVASWVLRIQRPGRRRSMASMPQALQAVTDEVFTARAAEVQAEPRTVGPRSAPNLTESLDLVRAPAIARPTTSSLAGAVVVAVSIRVMPAHGQANGCACVSASSVAPYMPERPIAPKPSRNTSGPSPLASNCLLSSPAAHVEHLPRLRMRSRHRQSE